ncbi:MAG: class I SAM-dependent methyltransferase [Actinomycetota bacterium]|jgi:SAM-dependent methyltransferase|nr:class I SAM-dependent methyltransferase [Actinomycetota bacterium]
MTDQPPVPSTTIDGLVDGVYPAMALVAAMQLDLLSPLSEGPRNAGHLAAARDLDPTRVRILLDALTVVGLLTRDAGRYGLTPESSTYLTTDSPWSRVAGGRVLHELWSATLETAVTVGSGNAPGSVDYTKLDSDDAVGFFEGLRGDAGAIAERMLPLLDVPQDGALLDLGGGAGGAASAFAGLRPDLAVKVLELPNLIAATEQLMARRDEHRIEIVAANATVEVPGEYDLIWSLFVTQTLGPDAAEQVVANAAKALRPSGRLAFVNVVVAPSRIEPPRAALFNLALMNLYDGGQAYSTADYERWLRSAGLRDIAWHDVNDTIRMVTATKP